MARTPDSDRLKEAMWQPLSEDRKAAHRASIEAAVNHAASVSRPMVRARRRFSVMAVTVALLALPAGMAVAAEGALPGDPLYPVKRVTETVRSWVDDDIVAEHRVEELEELLASDAASDRIVDQVDRAAAEVEQLDAGHPLRDRLSDVTGDRWQGSGDGGSDGPVQAATTTTRPDHQQTTTTVPRTTTSIVGVTTTTVVDSTTTTTTTVDRTTTTVSDRTTTTVGESKTVRLIGRVLAGPTCPVERQPPDPDCADRPVAGAILVVTDPEGREKAVLESDGEGRFMVRLEPGSYLLVPQPYDGLLGTASPQELVVDTEPVELVVRYDTGIR